MGTEFRVFRQQSFTLVEVLEVFHQDGRFVAAPFTVAKGWDETARVDVEEEFGLAVDVYFYVLVLQAFVLERDPDAVDEGTEARAVDFEVLFGGVGLDGFPGEAGGLFVVSFLALVAALVGI